MSKKRNCIFPWSHRWERTTGIDGRIYRFCHKCKKSEVMGDPEQDGTNLIGMEVWVDIPEDEYKKQCLPLEYKCDYEEIPVDKTRNLMDNSMYSHKITINGPDGKLTSAIRAKEVFWTEVFPKMFPFERDYRKVLGMSYHGSMVDKFLDDIYKDMEEHYEKIMHYHIKKAEE